MHSGDLLLSHAIYRTVPSLKKKEMTMTGAMTVKELKRAYRQLAAADRSDDAATFKRAYGARWLAFERLRREKVSLPADLKAKLDVCIAELQFYANDGAALQMMRSLRRDLTAMIGSRVDT